MTTKEAMLEPLAGSIPAIARDLDKLRTWQFRSRTSAFAVFLLSLFVMRSARAESPALMTAGIDLSPLSEESYSRLDGLALERICVLRLVQEGFAVVSLARMPRVRIVVNHLGGAVGLRAIGPAGELSREVPSQDGGSELHLELAQKMVELVRLTLRESVPVTPPQVEPPPSARSLPSSMRIEPAAGVDAMVRLQGLDLAVRIGLVVAHDMGLGVAITSSLCPSRGLGLSVLEWQIQAGVIYRLPVSKRVELSAALVAGALVHDYALADATARSPSGMVVDVLVSAPLSFAWHATPGLRLGVRLAPGVGSRVETVPAFAFVLEGVSPGSYPVITEEDFRRSSDRLGTARGAFYSPEGAVSPMTQGVVKLDSVIRGASPVVKGTFEVGFGADSATGTFEASPCPP